MKSHGLCGLLTQLRGQAKRQAVTAVYESRAMPEDHAVPGEKHLNKFIN